MEDRELRRQERLERLRSPKEQRQRLETTNVESDEVKRRLERISRFVETTDINLADAAEIPLAGGVRSIGRGGGPDWTKPRAEADSDVTPSGAWR